MSRLRDDYGAEIGMRVICQRCGEQTFRKQTGYNNMDAASANRHSFLDEFEKMPEGWKIKRDAGGWLCPRCNEEYDLLMERFRTNRGAVDGTHWMPLPEPPKEEEDDRH